MPDLKEILCRVRATKHKKKEVSEVVRDARAQSTPYQEVLDQLKKIKEKKAQLEQAIQGDLQSEVEQLERLSLDVKTDMQLLSDLALTKFMKGETIELTDENETKYEPIFKVTFKKLI